jgi:hypothetical protein
VTTGQEGRHFRKRRRLLRKPGLKRLPAKIGSSPILCYGALAAETAIRIRIVEARMISSAGMNGQETKWGQCNVPTSASPPEGVSCWAHSSCREAARTSHASLMRLQEADSDMPSVDEPLR